MRSIPQTLHTLYRHAVPHLSREELEDLALAPDFAKVLAYRARDVLNSIGTLVINDDADNGSFRSQEDVPSLLQMTADTFDTVSALIELGAFAEARLNMAAEAGEVAK